MVRRKMSILASDRQSDKKSGTDPVSVLDLAEGLPTAFNWAHLCRTSVPVPLRNLQSSCRARYPAIVLGCGGQLVNERAEEMFIAAAGISV